MDNIEEVIEEQRQVFGKRTDQIDRLLEQVQVEFDRATKELAAMEKDKALAKTLASVALGKIPKDDLVKLKARMRELEEQIRDFPQLRAGLEWEKGCLMTKKKQLFWNEEMFKKYLLLKELIQNEGPSSSYVEKLLSYAKSLDKEFCTGQLCFEDAQAFLDSVKTQGEIQP